MSPQEIISQRLANQQLSQHKFTKPEDLVAWMGAVQAQDFQAGLWAIGMRLKGAGIGDVQKAIIERKIVRTWPMRGTLHFVPAKDARWMLELLTPRVMRGYARRHQQLGISESMLKRSRDVLTKALRDGKQLTRPQIYEIFKKEKIPTQESRGLHILGRLAHDRLIIFGPHQGIQPTFVLFDEWIPKGRDLKGDQALYKLAKRYFQSHAPATVYDFAWWSGLAVTDARRAMASVTNNKLPITNYKSEAFLLPPWDEYLVAYKDRSAAIDAKHRPKAFGPGNGIFSPVVVINGKVEGTWNRKMEMKFLGN